MIAIAAMSENRVIGRGMEIPWHLPDDFKWFKNKTMGHVIVMGRKTFQSIGRPLPGRENVVLSRSEFVADGVRVIHTLEELEAFQDGREVFICGGAEIYRLTLEKWQELFLTVVHRTVEGDVLFPPFENQLKFHENVKVHPEFTVKHFKR